MLETGALSTHLHFLNEPLDGWQCPSRSFFLLRASAMLCYALLCLAWPKPAGEREGGRRRRIKCERKERRERERGRREPVQEYKRIFLVALQLLRKRMEGGVLSVEMAGKKRTGVALSRRLRKAVVFFVSPQMSLLVRSCQVRPDPHSCFIFLYTVHRTLNLDGEFLMHPSGRREGTK